MSEACRAIVARNDPHLHATALFAPEPGRSRLMVLYAFDIELSRASRVSNEPLIARMRLQWWRDVVKAARDGAPPPTHEVAGPFACLLVERNLPTEPVEALIAAREMELEAGFDERRFAEWADARFGALTALAAHLLSDGDAETVALARRAGPVLGAEFALRHAVAMAAEGRSMIPGLSDAARAALAGGEMTEDARETIGSLADSARARLSELRAGRARADRRATPAFLPLARAGRVLDRAARLAGSAVAPGALRLARDSIAGYPSMSAEGGDRPGGRIAADGWTPPVQASSPEVLPTPSPERPPGGGRALPGPGAGRSGEVGGSVSSESLARGPVGLADLGQAERPFDGLRLALRAATGRW